VENDKSREASETGCGVPEGLPKPARQFYWRVAIVDAEISCRRHDWNCCGGFQASRLGRRSVHRPGTRRWKRRAIVRCPWRDMSFTVWSERKRVEKLRYMHR